MEWNTYDLINHLNQYSEKDMLRAFYNIVEKDNLNEVVFTNGFKYAYTHGGTNNFFDISDNMDSFLWIEENAATILMEAEERAVYDSLPERLVLYRGTCTEELEDLEWGDVHGVSWSLDIEKARFFAKRKNGYGNRCVLKLTIDKENVLAYLKGMEESEMICLYPNCGEIEIVELFPGCGKNFPS